MIAVSVAACTMRRRREKTEMRRRAAVMVIIVIVGLFVRSWFVIAIASFLYAENLLFFTILYTLVLVGMIVVQSDFEFKDNPEARSRSHV